MQVFLEYVCDVLDNFSFKVHSKLRNILERHDTVPEVVWNICNSYNMGKSVHALVLVRRFQANQKCPCYN